MLAVFSSIFVADTKIFSDYNFVAPLTQDRKIILVLNLQKQPPELFYKNGVLKSFAKFPAKHLCQSPIFK